MKCYISQARDLVLSTYNYMYCIWQSDAIVTITACLLQNGRSNFHYLLSRLYHKSSQFTPYRGNFREAKYCCLWFSWLNTGPRIFYPRMKRPYLPLPAVQTTNWLILLNHEYFDPQKLPAIRYAIHNYAHMFGFLHFILILSVTVWSGGAEELRVSSRDEEIRATQHVEQVHIAWGEGVIH